MKWIFIILILILIFAGWRAAVFLVNNSNQTAGDALVATDTLAAKRPLNDSTGKASVKKGLHEVGAVEKKQLPVSIGDIDTRNVKPQQIVDYAKTLIGVPYLYGAADPAKGFDCSGFITYVFNHYGIIVPRSSIDFTNVGKEVSATNAKGGDLILFTGTDSTEHFVGHMGIVVSNTDTLRFIHSTSGKQHGVTITPLGTYYKKRFVKTIHVFKKE